jgi:hypothetical protein
MNWRVARSLDVLLDQLNAAFPNRSKVSDGSIGDTNHLVEGWTNSDHNPWYPLPNGGIVTARDFTHDPAHGVDIARLSDELAASCDPRIKYIIANSQILDSRPQFSPWQWVKYTGSNPHDHHLHLSVTDSPLCDDPRPWNLPMLGGDMSFDPPDRQLLKEVHEEVYRRLPTRVRKEDGGDPKADDTILGYACNSDMYGFLTQKRLTGIESDLAEIKAALTSRNP